MFSASILPMSEVKLDSFSKQTCSLTYKRVKNISFSGAAVAHRERS